MGVERQKKQGQQELAFMAAEKSETRTVVREGTETPIAEQGTESPTRSTALMEAICERENLIKAWKQVKGNKGSPGIDGMRVEEAGGYLKEHWPAIREELLQGRYKPQPVKRVEIPKAGGGKRKLGIPTVVDRIIQQAVAQVLEQEWDPTFSEHSYGFRPRRSAHQAVEQAQEYIREGYTIVVDMDLEKFFDRVNHDVMMGRVARRVGDKRVLKLIRGFLESGVMEDGLARATEAGVPQGGPLSPLLSNLLLDELDKELERRGLRYCRYADDANVYVKSERAGKRVMESLKKYLARKLKLQVNEEKSGVGAAKERKFLGFTIIEEGGEPKRSISGRSLERFKERVREITGRSRGISLEDMVAELSKYVRGWRGYYGFCETPRVLRDLDKWIRHRLRCMVWKSWRRGRTRYKKLRQRGIGEKLAAMTAGSSHGPWRASRGDAMHKALPIAYFRRLGLAELAPRRLV